MMSLLNLFTIVLFLFSQFALSYLTDRNGRRLNPPTNLQTSRNSLRSRQNHRPANNVSIRRNINVVERDQRPGAFPSNERLFYDQEFVQRSTVPEVEATEIPLAVAEPIPLTDQLQQFIFRRAPDSEVEANYDEKRIYGTNAFDEGENSEPIQAKNVKPIWF